MSVSIERRSTALTELAGQWTLSPSRLQAIALASHEHNGDTLAPPVSFLFRRPAAAFTVLSTSRQCRRRRHADLAVCPLGRQIKTARVNGWLRPRGRPPRRPPVDRNGSCWPAALKRMQLVAYVTGAVRVALSWCKSKIWHMDPAPTLSSLFGLLEDRTRRAGLSDVKFKFASEQVSAGPD